MSRCFFLQRFFDDVDVLLGEFRGFSRKRIFFVGPRAEVEQLATLGAERAKFVALVFSFRAASWTFNHQHMPRLSQHV